MRGKRKGAEAPFPIFRSVDRRDRLRRGVGIVLVDLDNPAPDMAARAAVAEIDGETDGGPDQEEDDALVIEAGEQIDAAEDRGRRDEPHDRRRERALEFGARAAQIPVSSIKAALGHTLGAAGAIGYGICEVLLENGAIASIPLQLIGPFLNEAELRADLAPGPTIDVNSRFKYSNHGFGLLAAQLARNDVPCVDPTPYRLSRFVDGSPLELAGI